MANSQRPTTAENPSNLIPAPVEGQEELISILVKRNPTTRNPVEQASNLTIEDEAADGVATLLAHWQV
jgi:hypothetical protein